MTEMEKRVMFRMAVKLVEHGIIEQDKEAENLVQWFLFNSRIKENNSEIRELMKNYKDTELPAREGVKEAIKRNQEICRLRDELYHQQNDLKGTVYQTGTRFKSIGNRGSPGVLAAALITIYACSSSSQGAA